MDAKEFFREIAKANYAEFLANPNSRRRLWNAIVSMNTVAEYVALHRLEYAEVPRETLDQEAQIVRATAPVFDELKYCAETFKHVRKIRDHRALATPFTTISTSTGVADDSVTWKINSYDLVQVVMRAASEFEKLPELS